MADINDAAREIAVKLDSGNEASVGHQLSLYAQSLTKNDFRQLLSKVDQIEKDGNGLDLVLKKDAQGTPVNYSVLPADHHASATQMAGLIDRGAEREAEALMQEVTADIYASSPREQAQTKYALWSMAVDAYEKDGVGVDVSVDRTKPGIEGIAWLKNQPTISQRDRP